LKHSTRVGRLPEYGAFPRAERRRGYRRLRCSAMATQWPPAPGRSRREPPDPARLAPGGPGSRPGRHATFEAANSDTFPDSSAKEYDVIKATVRADLVANPQKSLGYLTLAHYLNGRSRTYSR
jgi:hypothetical protein